MNPKTPQDLDPKLKEAYDRVMGGNFNPIPPASKIPEIPKTEAPAAPLPSPAVAPPPPSIPLTNPVEPSQPELPPLNVMSPSTTSSTGKQAASAKKKLKISPIIFLVIGLAFFVVYAVVWGKVLKLF